MSEDDDFKASAHEAGGQPPQRSRIRVRAWHILLLILAVITSLLLAYWQWSRYQSGTGTFQNLGYAMQWPVFGAFFVYAYRAGLKMENDKIDAVNSGESLEQLYEADLAAYGDKQGDSDSSEITEIDADFLPPRPTLDVAEFNALNQPERARPPHTES